jgi:hypothetical protein
MRNPATTDNSAYHRHMTGGGRQVMDYAGAEVPRRRPRFLLWLIASVLFLAATCGSMLAYVWWLKLG